MIKRMNKESCTALRYRIDTALQSLGKELGVSIKVGSGTYTEYEVDFKLKVSVLNEDGASKQDAKDFLQYACYYGFDEADLGKDFTSKGRQFKIVGWNNRRRKYPVTVREVYTGVTWHFPPRQVLQALGKPGKIVV